MSQPEEFAPAGADRPPTKDEEAAADEIAEEIDVDEVAEEYEHMTALGAHAKGEGQIEPDPHPSS